jgi:hypothetical protein
MQNTVNIRSRNIFKVAIAQVMLFRMKFLRPSLGWLNFASVDI